MNVNKIIDLYKKQRLTQEEFAEKVGISKTAISQILLEKSNPRIKLVEKIAAYFQVPVGYFFDEVGEVPLGNAGNIVHNANGSTIMQSIGEMQCRKELEAANKKIMELQDKIIKLQEKK